MKTNTELARAMFEACEGGSVLGAFSLAITVNSAFPVDTVEAGEMKSGVQDAYDAMRRDLEGANPSPLERILVERVVACHADLYAAEVYYKGKDGWHWDKAQQKIQLMRDRLLSAVKMLAQVRKMQLPNVQVNLAEKQINVMA